MGCEAPPGNAMGGQRAGPIVRGLKRRLHLAESPAVRFSRRTWKLGRFDDTSGCLTGNARSEGNG